MNPECEYWTYIFKETSFPWDDTVLPLLKMFTTLQVALGGCGSPQAKIQVAKPCAYYAPLCMCKFQAKTFQSYTYICKKIFCIFTFFILEVKSATKCQINSNLG